ncbi:glycosyltransferase family 4 protein [Schaalia sp. Marseille-Q2122]|uniref:glycosyltransferase family 4 protein n=1 Tax=Schaalia sp. Marseille-Q2122 TaxID=2736604 RepID=UPI00158BDA66|nr:glycosyltransferase family 4 protein [Schaalia sp. Marseille-Q2122]
MRIAYVCVDPGIPVFGTKGASVHIQEVIRQMRARGHEVTVHAVRRGNEVPADLADLQVIDYPIHVKEPAERELAQQEASRAIADTLILDAPDVVYERYSLFSTVIADLRAAATQRAGEHSWEPVSILEVNAPLIEEQAAHRILVHEEDAWAALRAQVQAANATICVSDPVSGWVRAHTGSERVHTVANGVNVERIHPQPEDPSAVVVTFVGTLKPWHGVPDLLEAASLAERPWQLRILGDGPERAVLEERARDLGVDADFRGAIPPADMPAHLAGSAIAVAPYPAPDSEDAHYFSPLKVYEYMAAGLPVVATSIGQIPEVLQGAGVLVTPSAPAELSAAIDALAADPALRADLGAKGRDLAQTQHSWAGVVARIFRLAGLTDMDVEES